MRIGTHPVKCKKCGYGWLAMSTTPKTCPQCRTLLWNSDRSYRDETLEEKFWKRVEKSVAGCWLWKGSTKSTGYGNLRVKAGTTGYDSHRLSWIIHFGEIPAGFHVCHRCDVPGCVRPDHLFLGTPKENNSDCISKARHQHGENHAHAKLDWAKVEAIRSLRKQGGHSFARLGKLFGVHAMTIHSVILEKTWKPSLHPANVQP